jgi:hypothetical protein
LGVASLTGSTPDIHQLVLADLVGLMLVVSDYMICYVSHKNSLDFCDSNSTITFKQTPFQATSTASKCQHQQHQMLKMMTRKQQQ